MPKDKEKTALKSDMLSIFFENLSLLIGSGLPLFQCVSLMKEDVGDDDFGKLLRSLEDALKETPYLHEAMEKTGMFPEYAVRMVQIGEMSGRMENVLESLGHYYNRENQIKAQIRSAVLNPFVLICIMCVVIVFLIVQVLPVFGDVYSQFGISMESNAVVSAAITLGNIAMWVVIALLVIVIISMLMSLTQGGRKALARFFERFPLTRQSSYLLDVTRFTSSLALQLASGVDIQTAFRLAMETTGNSRLRNKLDKARPRVEMGDDLGDALSEAKIYKSSTSSLLMSGVKAGASERVLQRIADMYEEEAEQSMENMLSLIEPILIGFLSVVIGIILICIMFPLIGLMSSIG